jgi:hypothetical protein
MKQGTSSELDFQYQNSDISGQSAIPLYSVMKLDGVNNQMLFPTTGAKIVFSGDTNIYRSSSNVLKTDGNLIVNGLTASRALTTNGSNQLTSSVATAAELAFLSGVTSAVQTQLDAKMPKSGGVFTGNITVPAGTTAAPSINFSASTTTGLSAATANTLSLSTNAVERLSISSSGTVTVKNLTSAGVVCILEKLCGTAK